MGIEARSLPINYRAFSDLAWKRRALRWGDEREAIACKITIHSHEYKPWEAIDFCWLPETKSHLSVH